WNAAILRADSLHPNGVQVNGLDDIRHHLDLCHVESKPEDPLSQEDLDAILGPGRHAHLCNFYDRTPFVYEWFYSAFHVSEPAPSRPKNAVAAVFARQGVEVVHGSVLIVKNGPAGGEWVRDVQIDADAVARTLWWYHRSGNTVS
ncbi:hypothetical protein BV25DRAFT_1812315, partial [Artomyces pyxidatus]